MGPHNKSMTFLYEKHHSAREVESPAEHAPRPCRHPETGWGRPLKIRKAPLPEDRRFLRSRICFFTPVGLSRVLRSIKNQHTETIIKNVFFFSWEYQGRFSPT